MLADRTPKLHRTYCIDFGGWTRSEISPKVSYQVWIGKITTFWNFPTPVIRQLSSQENFFNYPQNGTTKWHKNHRNDTCPCKNEFHIEFEWYSDMLRFAKGASPHQKIPKNYNLPCWHDFQLSSEDLSSKVIHLLQNWKIIFCCNRSGPNNIHSSFEVM